MFFKVQSTVVLYGPCNINKTTLIFMVMGRMNQWWRSGGSPVLRTEGWGLAGSHWSDIIGSYHSTGSLDPTGAARDEVYAVDLIAWG